MDEINIRDLIQAGFHFGHRTSRWNPKMKSFIFKRRNLIHIIDLRETMRGLIVGRKLAQAVAARGGYVLFVGTKKQAAGLVRREANHCGMPYVAERWPGGLLTNYVTIRQRLERLEELEELEETGQMGLYSKKMVSSLRREKRKILRNLGGVREMDRLPGLLVVVDPAREHIAVSEAVKLEIPIIALTDTDGDPDDLDVVVAGNDDSIAAIEIYLQQMSEGVLNGLSQRGISPPAAEEEAEQPEPAEPPAEAEAAEEEPEPETAEEKAEEPQETEPAAAEEPAGEQAEEAEQTEPPAEPETEEPAAEEAQEPEATEEPAEEEAEVEQTEPPAEPEMEEPPAEEAQEPEATEEPAEEEAEVEQTEPPAEPEMEEPPAEEPEEPEAAEEPAEDEGGEAADETGAVEAEAEAAEDDEED
ncbi:MAG: 30S ribosomal protein S2 [Candidatus Brocadiia bacterium]